ncbi:retrotransposon protein, putative, ty1-copia subclass [Tanacetum coccineum]
MGLQLLQLEIRLGKIPLRSFRPMKLAEILWQFWASSSFRVSLAQDLHHLEEALLEAPPVTAIVAVRNAYTCRVTDQQEVACLILQAEQELFETVKAFHACKQEEGQSVSTYHKIPPPTKKEHPAKDTECYHCHKTRHWKRNCPLYLAELKKNKASKSSTSGIFTIELFSFPKSNTWNYDTGCGTHIYNTIQGLRGYQKLNKGALDLFVGNGYSAAVKAIGSFELIIPSGMIVVLDNCHFSPSITRGIVSLSRLWEKKCIVKLQHDGLLALIDDESFDVCLSCISGKMARKPFTFASERADDLLGIIHGDVCGPFRPMSREGANNYITFINDFSRYGYVYLIKHKHEVFEMFKTFQSEVENQLGKTIKELRLDRGGEYLSQEFFKSSKESWGHLITYSSIYATT